GSGHLHGLLYNGRSLLDIERDALHRETRRQQRLHEEADVLVTQRRWDALGRLEDVQVEGARRGQAADAIPSHLLGQWRQRHYRYAAAGQLAALQTAGGDVHYRYDAPGRLIGALRADGEQRWPFDPAGNRLPSLPEEYSQGPAPGPIRDTDGWAAQVRSQWFDSGFDVLGLHGATPALPADGVARWHGNRIGCSEDATYLYDSRGNRTQAMHANGRRLLMHYDGANRLVEVQMFDQQASYVCSYTYDAHGRRLRKTVRERAHPLAEVQESRTCYGWDGDRRVRTQHWRPGGDKQTTHTIYEPGSFTPLIQLEMVDAASTGAPAAQTTGRQAQQALGDAFKNLPTDIRRNMEDLLQQAVARALPSPIIVRHYHCDALGTPQALTDEHGDPVWMARPDPWGNLQEEYNPHGIDQPIRLPGQHHDAETGLHYNRHRYYDPRPGTYVNQDPIGLQGGPNPYSYAANPLEWIDPLGLNPAGCAVGASIGVWGGGVGAVPGCAIGAGVGTALVLGAVALGLSGDTPQHSNTAAKTDSWGVPIDPKADTLSQAHKNAISRTSPGYGGNCSPDEYDRLHDDYKQKCGQSDRLGACTSGMSPSQLSARRQAFGQCARAREEIMNQCFAGGDYNHRQQAGNVWNAYKNCAGTP
ncbi:RHS repeat-associated core domain-containing protein, partial [Variovorax atrisoli]|uniref:RHS repeat-associated core domain-containing protein n=1 Tax=Variovorax atrisoli TaxID=3394203 RepID=UPI0033976D37